MEAMSAMRGAEIVAVDESLALEAADVSLERGLAMADSLLYVTAARFGATLVTADINFEGLSNVVVVSCSGTKAPKGVSFIPFSCPTPAE